MLNLNNSGTQTACYPRNCLSPLFFWLISLLFGLIFAESFLSFRLISYAKTLYSSIFNYACYVFDFKQDCSKTCVSNPDSRLLEIITVLEQDLRRARMVISASDGCDERSCLSRESAHPCVPSLGAFSAALQVHINNRLMRKDVQTLWFSGWS